MNSNLTPIIIGFSLEKELKSQVQFFNRSLDRSRINLETCIPHVTLWMGFVKNEQLPALNLGLEKIFRNVFIHTEVEQLTDFTNELGTSWSMSLQLNRSLYLLQNRIHHFFEPFREIGEKYEDCNSITIDYINNFVSKSLDNYSPHITIGFGDSLAVNPTFLPVFLKNPDMFEAGNYCTCVRRIQSVGKNTVS